MLLVMMSDTLGFNAHVFCFYILYIYIYTLVLERKGNKLMPNQIKILQTKNALTFVPTCFVFKILGTKFKLLKF